MNYDMLQFALLTVPMSMAVCLACAIVVIAATTTGTLLRLHDLRSARIWDWDLAWRCMRCDRGEPRHIMRETQTSEIQKTPSGKYALVKPDRLYVCRCGSATTMQRWIGRRRYTLHTEWTGAVLQERWEWAAIEELPAEIRAMLPTGAPAGSTLVN